MERIAGYSVPLFKGDPRLPKQDIDHWFQGVLTETGTPKVRPHLYGADAGLCARRNVLLAHNTWLATEVSASSNAYMSIGVALEDMLARGLNNKERLYAQNLWLQEIPELKIRGKIDLVILDHTDQLALIEVKTCGKLPDAPRPTHLAQIQTYAAVSGLHNAYLTYISRNVRDTFGPELALRTFPVSCTEAELTSRLHTAVLSELCSAQHALPPKPAHFRKHTECHYCEFRDYSCWEPRPGLRSAAAQSADFEPLPELDVETLVNLHLRAEKEAKAIYDNSVYRLKDMLSELSEIDHPRHLNVALRAALCAVKDALST